MVWHQDGARYDFAGGDLTGADLEGTDFTGAELDGTDLRGADMAEALGLIRAQIEEACWDASTTLPPALASQTLTPKGCDGPDDDD